MITDFDDHARRPQVAILLFPGHTNIDVVGPQSVLAFDTEVHRVWKDCEAVVGDTGMRILPTTTLRECPRNVDVLLVPGGASVKDLVGDLEVLEWVADMASRARYVTSDCTGAIVLGAAGLLDGYRAATHWTTRGTLEQFGATMVEERFVIDRNRITGGGATASMDFGLVLLAELLGEERAQAAQLMLEYDPQPPFDAGSPDRAPQHLVDGVRAAVADAVDQIALQADRLERQGWGRARATV